MKALRKGLQMAKIYAALIIKGKKSINDVPTNLKDEVQRILSELS